MDIKEKIESGSSPREIVSSLVEAVKKFDGVEIDTTYWQRNFGLTEFEEDVEEFGVDMRKVKQAVDAINKEGKTLEGGTPNQRLFSRGSVFVVEVDGNTREFPFNKRAQFNAHVVWFAMQNGDPSRHLREATEVESMTEQDEVAKIFIDGEPWFIKKIDITHLSMANTRAGAERANGLTVRNVGEFRGEPIFDDLRAWLRGRLNIEGNTYRSS